MAPSGNRTPFSLTGDSKRYTPLARLYDSARGTLGKILESKREFEAHQRNTR